jgi:hypothetical protein
MGKIKELAIDQLNQERQYNVTVLGEFRFGSEHETSAFRGRFLEFIQHEKNIHILEEDMDITMRTREYKRSYGNIVEVGSKQTTMRI